MPQVLAAERVAPRSPVFCRWAWMPICQIPCLKKTWRQTAWRLLLEQQHVMLHAGAHDRSSQPPWLLALLWLVLPLELPWPPELLSLLGLRAAHAVVSTLPPAGAAGWLVEAQAPPCAAVLPCQAQVAQHAQEWELAQGWRPQRVLQRVCLAEQTCVSCAPRPE